MLKAGWKIPWFWSLVVGLLWNCSGGQGPEKTAVPHVPRGYAPVLEFVHHGRQLRFGPFVGYYFRPEVPDNMSRIRLVCFNEGKFYSSDAPENALLYEGDGILTDLPFVEKAVPQGAERIQPIFFPEAPSAWLETRPEPRDAYVHFHSCHDASGAVLTGFWIRHVAVRDFTYDMGGRVGPDSPLYHRVFKGQDTGFPRIIEFDHGKPKL